MSVADGRAVAAAGRAADRVVQVGHIFRFHPVTATLRDALAGERIGAVRYATGRFSGFKRPRTDVGVTHTDAIHYFDLFAYLLGREATGVLGHPARLPGARTRRHVVTTVSYGDVPVIVEANYFVPGTHRECVIVGERGALVADYRRLHRDAPRRRAPPARGCLGRDRHREGRAGRRGAGAAAAGAGDVPRGLPRAARQPGPCRGRRARRSRSWRRRPAPLGSTARSPSPRSLAPQPHQPAPEADSSRGAGRSSERLSARIDHYRRASVPPPPRVGGASRTRYWCSVVQTGHH